MKWVYYIIAVGLSICALYFTFKNVPFFNIWVYSKSIDFKWIIISIGINFFSFLIRAYRWHLIVNQIHPITFRTAYHLTSIAFMMNSLLPGRMGEFARPAILNKIENVPIVSGFTTIVTERLFDLIMLCLMYITVIFFIDIDPNYQMNIGAYTLSHTLLTSVAYHIFLVFLFFIICIVSVNIKEVRSLIKKILLKVPHVIFWTELQTRNNIERKCIHPIIRLIDYVSDGFSFFKRPLVIVNCFVLSMALWILIAFSNYLMTLGCKNMNVEFIEMCAVLVIVCFFISLPSVPGAWGLWEAGGIFALTMFGIGKQEATAYTIVNHATSLFPIIVAGIISLMITGVSIRFSRDNPENV